MRQLAFLCLLGSTVALAQQKRMLVMATGQCSDTLLSQALENMQSALSKQYGPAVLSLGELRGVLGAAPEYTLEEVRRHFQAVRAVFDAARYVEAESQALDVLSQVETLSPSPETTRMSFELSTLLALIYRGQGRTDAYDLMLRRILHLNPSYQLPARETAPSVRKHFDTLRERLASAPKQALTVQSSPEGAEVFIDGRSMGLTPLTLELPSAVYRMVLTLEGQTSFTRSVALKAPVTFSVDMGFESTLDSRKIACLNTPSKAPAPWEAAIRLATHVGASNVVLVRLERSELGPDWLEATLLSLPDGRKVRAGGIKLLKEGLSPEHVSELASFIHTGAQAPRVQASAGVDAPTMRVAWNRVGAVTTAALGAVAIGLGVSSSMRSNNDWREYNAARSQPLVAGTPEAANAAQYASQAQSAQTQALWLYVAGAAAVAGGATWWLLDKPETPRLSVAVGPGTVYGTLTFVWADHSPR